MWTDPNQGRSTTSKEGKASTSNRSKGVHGRSCFLPTPSHTILGSKRTQKPFLFLK